MSVASGQMPAAISVSADATNLAAGTYQGNIEITAQGATPPAASVPVSFVVTSAGAARLWVEPPALSFQVISGGTAPSQSLRIGNSGGGAISWSAAAATVTGNWLAISPASGAAGAAAPATLTVSVNAAGLAAGSYSGAIIVSSPQTNQSIAVAASLLVSASEGALLLSQGSLLFRAVEGGGAEPPQTFGVLNIGGGTLDWAAQAVLLEQVPWLRLTPASGPSDAGAAQIPLVTVSVEATGLTAGFYIGLIRVASAQANNSPQWLRVDFEVLPRGTRLGAVVRPTGLIFVAAAGGTAPVSQEVSVATPETSPIQFVSQPIGGEWVSRTPDSATASGATPGRISVQARPSTLAAGVYRAGLTVLTQNDGELHPVNLLFVVLPPGAVTAAATGGDGVAAAGPFAAACTATKLLLQFSSVFANFNATVGWPTLVRLNMRDDCGNAAAGGNAVLTFSSGDPALPLADLKNGQYLGSWRPNSANAQVIVTAQGTWRGLQGQAAATARVAGNPNTQAAILNQGGVLLGAGFERGLIAPGSIVSLFGQKLAAAENRASSLPLPRTLGGVRVRIGEREAPLFYVGPGQVNVQAPFEVAAERQLQVVVETNGVPSAPEPIQTAATRPGIFTLGPPFGDQGAILLANTNRLAMAARPDMPSEPARMNGPVSIFCTGLGLTNPLVASGEPGPSAPLATVRTAVAVTIGGQPAQVTFAGLAPGFVGVYQVNAEVPAGITPGDAVPVVITQGGFRSNTATIAVR